MDYSNAIGQLGAHAGPVLTALAAVPLALFGISRWRRRRRVNAEYAAALALIRAPYTLREALSSCRSQIIECGETPPGRGGPMDSMIAADAAVREALPAIVGKYRSSGVLTWALLHEIEADVMAHLASTGQHRKRVLDLIRAPVRVDYPEDERPVSFEGCDLVSVVFQAIEEVWRRAEDERGIVPMSIGPHTSGTVTKDTVTSNAHA
ncbi:DUF2471 domain-containing protein [Paraburkholderia strydomiana]|uniref:DUF2471 domain-containing protein n=1 Tax=Paraburkholderia strydomiana TaxID=1245417 RepID=UPI001BE51EE7|nr:DUF2471 domain-containing protein [Paraburkholderia strydomiana]MBT2793606.1 hypothetical protein [Paraburkholderia strydomiana]